MQLTLKTLQVSMRALQKCWEREGGSSSLLSTIWMLNKLWISCDTSENICIWYPEVGQTGQRRIRTFYKINWIHRIGGGQLIWFCYSTMIKWCKILLKYVGGKIFRILIFNRIDYSYVLHGWFILTLSQENSLQGHYWSVK